MACGTIIGDSLAVGAGMTSIVAAEAAGRVIVAKIIGMNSPGDMHVGKDVAQVNCRNFIARLLHQSTPRLIDLWVIGAIEIVEVGGYVLPCHIAGGIIHFEKLDRLFLNERKLGTDVSRRHLLVHSVFGQLEDVGGPVVAIHAIHHAILSFFQLLLSWLGIGGNEFGRLPLIVGVIDDWNRLPLNILVEM